MADRIDRALEDEDLNETLDDLSKTLTDDDIETSNPTSGSYAITDEEGDEGDITDVGDMGDDGDGDADTDDV